MIPVSEGVVESMNPQAVILISANTEWRILKQLIDIDFPIRKSPFGEWFPYAFNTGTARLNTIVFHGGWGKIAAAASAQYAIDTWHPPILINIGTCGGFEGRVSRGEVLLVEKTIVYDIFEKMGDPDEHLLHYTTEIDLSWLTGSLPLPVKRTMLVSADRDLDGAEISGLAARFGAIAGDWESGAIAFVTWRNGVRCLILKGVSDLVGDGGGEAYSDRRVYVEGTRFVMSRLWETMPGWLMAAGLGTGSHRHIE